MKTIEQAVQAKRESKYIDFKAKFGDEKHDWCEIVKDVVAMANSGGGVIIFGLNNKGQPTGEDVSNVLDIDPATITDKVNQYTGCQFADFEIVEAQKDSHTVAVLSVTANQVPMVFVRPGTYPTGDRKQKNAFSKGTVYFRHGAKSEPGTTEDLARTIERRLNCVRHEWLTGVRRVVQAPSGSQVAILPPEIRDSDDADAVPIRIVDDDSVQAYRYVDIDNTHPYRQKEVIAEVKKKLPTGTVFNQYDVQVLRKVYSGLEQRTYSHQLRFGGRQYSKRTVDWIVSKFQNDNEIFSKARIECRKR